MSKAKHKIGAVANFAAYLLLLSGVGACSADTTFSSSSNWLTCHSDDECVAAFGEGSCSTNQICVDEDNEPIPRDRQKDVSPASDSGVNREQTTPRADAASSETPTSDASATTSTVESDVTFTNDASNSAPTTTNSDASTSDTSDPADIRQACTYSCSQTGMYRLPQALCEDARLHLDAKMYEFCNQNPTEGTCEEACIRVLSGVSPACAEELPDTITCVADSGFYSMGVNVPTPSPDSCLFPRCQPELLRMASECSQRREEWQTATNLWALSGAESYRFKYLERTIRVEGDVAMVVEGEPLEAPPSVKGLFEMIEASFETLEQPTLVTYDPVLGHPMHVVSYVIGTETQCAVRSNDIELTEFTLE